MPLDSLLPLISKTRSTLSPAEFHRVVNVVFHDIEAAHYDSLHADMWESLGEQLELLVADVSLRDGLKLLDIGCGTGLSTQLLLDGKLGPKISSVTLADTSQQMLAVAKERAEGWGREVHFHHGEINGIRGRFDIVLVCSVLHHIPDLGHFLNKISSLQEPGAIFIHLQDPNGDHLDDSQYIDRLKEFESTQKTPARKKLLKYVPAKLKSAARRLLGRQNYIDQVNDRLIGKNAIAVRMTQEEIWSVTDIHVDGLPFSIGRGISLTRMPNQLDNYELLSSRSYGFFGYLKSSLTQEFKIREQQLIDGHKPNGRYIAGLWKKR